MNQKVLDIFLPKERSLDQLKNFSFLKKMISEIELFFSNEENFLLLNIKEDLIRNYLLVMFLNVNQKQENNIATLTAIGNQIKKYYQIQDLIYQG